MYQLKEHCLLIFISSTSLVTHATLQTKPPTGCLRQLHYVVVYGTVFVFSIAGHVIPDCKTCSGVFNPLYFNS